jgi:hypothetical protein
VTTQDPSMRVIAMLHQLGVMSRSPATRCSLPEQPESPAYGVIW